MASKAKNVFKRAGYDLPILVLTWPLDFLRDITIPMAENSAWDRNRATVFPMTLPFAFSILWKLLLEKETQQKALMICLYALIPGFCISVYIRTRTTHSRPPPVIMFILTLCAFLMSIVWISFTSDIVIDLLEILGFILSVSPAVLGFSLLAWGNCLGDLNADVAMTKKGFGEMAITGCMAGPVFNVLMGVGVAMAAQFTGGKVTSCEWSLFDNETGEMKRTVLIPFVLICGTLLVHWIILINACLNNYKLSFKGMIPNLILYAIIVIFLIVFTLVGEKS